MRVLSVNVGPIARIPWEGQTVETAFRKRTVDGSIHLRGTSLVGDEQANRQGHGGPRKSVYVYPSEHYPFWKSALRQPDLPWGSFGENLTAEGWSEDEAHVGDAVRIGSAEFVVTQPRWPCFKMNAAFGRADMIQRFEEARRFGFYLGAVRDGTIGAGDTVELLARQAGAPSIAEVIASDRESQGKTSPG
ncbi:MAG: MOSC domain-containing protein [Thermoplasmata archaeon]|nr:MOSC domain-containing protein [Thermoplasmata archaeon]